MSQESRRKALRDKRPHAVPPGAPTGPGAWQITPDQSDRNGDFSRKKMRRRFRPRVPRPSNPQYA